MFAALKTTIVFAGLVAALPKPTPKCPVLFDGSVALTTKAADFDATTSKYNSGYIKGQNQTWAQIIKFPVVLPSLFDIPKLSKAVEITLSDASIFLAGGTLQPGFRRSELLPGINNGTDVTVQGKTTFHWSVRDDPRRPLNYTHEYHGAWHETNDYSTSQFNFKLGTPFDPKGESVPVKGDGRTLRITGLQSRRPEETFFSAPFKSGVWHNLAVTIGWEDNTFAVYYSRGYEPLKRVAGPVPNVNVGQGQFHLGVFKLPTGPQGIDVAHEGYQSPNLNEGLIYGGIFIEDSKDGCVTLKP